MKIIVVTESGQVVHEAEVKATATFTDTDGHALGTMDLPDMKILVTDDGKLVPQ